MAVSTASATTTTAYITPPSCGALAGVTAICLPFFLAAQGPMWRMVVLDQLGRPRRSGLRTRLVDMVGQGAGRHLSTALSSAVVLAVLGCLIVLAVLALGNRRGRFAGVWVTACGVVLLSTPSWYSHYAALATAPIALVVGAGVGRLKTVLAIRPPWGRRILTALVVLALAGYALPLRYARPAPVSPLRPSVRRR